MDEHCDAIESDLSRYHGKSLRGLFTGELTWRELGSYLAHLPMESALRTEQRDAMTDDELANDDAGFGPWSKTQYLLAELKDAVDQLTFTTIRMNAKHPDQIKPPDPRRRPGVTGKRVPKVDPRNYAVIEEIRRLHREAS